MTETYTAGVWKVRAGEEGEFVEAWRDFAAWASTMPGSGTLRLTRDVADPSRFFSFAPWESIEAIRRWKSSDEFRERIGRVKRHTDEFTPSEFELATVVGGREPVGAG
jgi:heme-degrading monooxygenase HmoA